MYIVGIAMYIVGAKHLHVCRRIWTHIPQMLRPYIDDSMATMR
jgi:hypothetical protein